MDEENLAQLSSMGSLTRRSGLRNIYRCNGSLRCHVLEGLLAFIAPGGGGAGILGGFSFGGDGESSENGSNDPDARDSLLPDEVDELMLGYLDESSKSDLRRSRVVSLPVLEEEACRPGAALESPDPIWPISITDPPSFPFPFEEYPRPGGTVGPRVVWSA